MSNDTPPILSDWYELIEGDDLMQGDFLEGCPVFRPPTNLEWPISETLEELNVTLGKQDTIIRSSSSNEISLPRTPRTSFRSILYASGATSRYPTIQERQS